MDALVWRLSFSLHALRSFLGGSGAAALFPRRREFLANATQARMEHHSSSSVSKSMPPAAKARISRPGGVILHARRSPLSILGEGAVLDRALPTESERQGREGSAFAWVDKCPVERAVQTRRQVCGDGLGGREEEMRVNWIRGDRSDRYVSRQASSPEFHHVEDR